MSEHPSVTIDYELTRGLDEVTRKIELCTRQLYFIDVVMLYRKECRIDCDALAGPLSILYTLLDEASTQLASINHPINQSRRAVHEEHMATKKEEF